MSPRATVFVLSSLLAPAAAAQSPVTFANAAPIEIDSASDDDEEGTPWRVARPYPSTIDVGGFGPEDRIATVTVTLHGMYHDFPDDVDMLLVAPDGKTLVLFSDACGDVWDSDIELSITLDDAAREPLPDEWPIEDDGAFRPSNYENDVEDVPDVFPGEDAAGHPAPHPQPSLATRLAVFAGSRPNGAWQLFVVDDEPDDAGHIAGGWNLTIATREATASFRRGDADGDGTVGLTDAVFTLAALFQGGAQPACTDAADADDDGALSLADAVHTLGHLFRGGPAPPAPGPGACGIDPTADDLGCNSPPPCPARCFGGQESCDGVCVEIQLDPANCGGCGIVCPPGQSCRGGVCQESEPCCGF